MALKEKVNQVKVEDEINNIMKDFNIQIVIPKDKNKKEKKD